MAILPLLLLAFPAPQAAPAAPDPVTAAEQALRVLEREGRLEPEGEVTLRFTAGLTGVDQERLREAMGRRLPGLRGGEGASGQRLEVGVHRAGNQETLELRVQGQAPVQVPFVRKDWVRPLVDRAADETAVAVRRSSGSSFAVVGELASDERDARQSAARRAAERIGEGLRQGAIARYGVLGTLQRFRARMDRVVARTLAPTVLADNAVQDEFLERREFSVGQMTRAYLLVDLDSKAVRAARQSIEREARVAAREVTVRAGSVAVSWAVLWFLGALLNRWTRGYMPWRIRASSVALGGGLFWLLWLA